jgi:hypothetical protein
MFPRAASYDTGPTAFFKAVSQAFKETICAKRKARAILGKRYTLRLSIVSRKMSQIHAVACGWKRA